MVLSCIGAVIGYAERRLPPMRGVFATESLCYIREAVSPGQIDSVAVAVRGLTASMACFFILYVLNSTSRNTSPASAKALRKASFLSSVLSACFSD